MTIMNIRNNNWTGGVICPDDIKSGAGPKIPAHSAAKSAF